MHQEQAFDSQGRFEGEPHWHPFRRMGREILQAIGQRAEQQYQMGRGGFRGGGGPGGGPGWGHGFPFGGHGSPPFWGPFGRGSQQGGKRVKRGNVRQALLTLLAEQPRNGYQLIQEIGERSGGHWRPSSGSVYPTLQQLEDEGLICSEAVEGGKLFALTEAGQAVVKELSEDSTPPWEGLGENLSEQEAEMQQLIGQVMGAVMMLGQTGSAAQQEKARKLLKQLRRSLYQILADEEEET